MKLKRLIQKLDEVEEKYRDLYVQQEDGTFMLDDDDDSYKTKLAEFRTNNRNLFKDNEEFKKRLKALEGIDPEDYQKMKERVASLDLEEDNELLKKGGLKAVLEKRTKGMKDNYDKMVNELKTANQTLAEQNKDFRNKLSRSLIETTAVSAANEIAVIRKNAKKDFINRVTEDWKVNDKMELEIDRYDSDGNKLDMPKYVRKLVEEAPHLFEEGSGSGSPGARVNAQGTVKTIPNDPALISKHLKDIAEGKVVVNY